MFSGIVLQRLVLAQLFVSSSFQLLSKCSSVLKAKVFLLYLNILISHIYSFKLETGVFPSIQGIKLSQKTHSYTHSHRNENAKQIQRTLLRTNYFQQITGFFFPGDTSFWRNTYFQMPFEGLLVQIHSINRVKILEKKSHTYTDVALSPSVRKK